jgi:hypothetical protein
MELDEKTKDAIYEKVGTLIGSMAAGIVVGAAIAILAKLIAVNYKSSTMAGDQELSPTKDEVNISKVDAAASETEGKLAQDKVSGVNGDLAANETDANASTAEATAADSGASALRTKAGAADIESKALKMT